MVENNEEIGLNLLDTPIGPKKKKKSVNLEICCSMSGSIGTVDLNVLLVLMRWGGAVCLGMLWRRRLFYRRISSWKA